MSHYKEVRKREKTRLETIKNIFKTFFFNLNNSFSTQGIFQHSIQSIEKIDAQVLCEELFSIQALFTPSEQKRIKKAAK